MMGRRSFVCCIEEAETGPAEEPLPLPKAAAAETATPLARDNGQV